MDISLLLTFFKWCSVINGFILLSWSLVAMFAADLMYRTQIKWFPIQRETFNVVIYSFLGLYKIFFIFFNLVPFLALAIAG